MKLRIVLADDHAMVREGLKRLIENEPDMQVVGEAEDGEAAVAIAAAARPDILIVDISMPKKGGVEAARLVRAIAPQVRILALTVHEDTGYLQALTEVGANGYLLKRAAANELVAALRTVASGGTYIDPRLQTRLRAPSAGAAPLRGNPGAEISEREREVLQRIAQGFSNKEIAAELNVSVKTVETYKARAMEKLGLRSRVDIVRYAMHQGWVMHV